MTPRPLQAHELGAVAPLLTQTNAGPELAALEADLRNSFTAWPSLQLVVDDGGQLVGLVAGRLDSRDPTLGWSDDIIVRPSHRGRGLGDALIEAQLAAFRALGCTRVRGLSPQSLAPQIAFFARHGFRVVEEETAQGLWGIRDGERLFITEHVVDRR